MPSSATLTGLPVLALAKTAVTSVAPFTSNTTRSSIGPSPSCTVPTQALAAGAEQPERDRPALDRALELDGDGVAIGHRHGRGHHLVKARRCVGREVQRTVPRVEVGRRRALPCERNRTRRSPRCRGRLGRQGRHMAARDGGEAPRRLVGIVDRLAEIGPGELRVGAALFQRIGVGIDRRRDGRDLRADAHQRVMHPHQDRAGLDGRTRDPCDENAT